jgi:UDP-glucose 4-epimerase
MKIAITGHSGFVGNVLFHKLAKLSPTCIGRVRPKFIDCNNFISYDLFSRENIMAQLDVIEIVIHCAGRTHIMDDDSSNPLEAFREVNTYGTLNLAQQAADAGVKRFIFLSTIKVNGESTELGLPFKSDDTFISTDPYGLSKYEAEIGLHKIARETGMEVVIIRPPLVYGSGVKANFASMMKWVNKGVPLPLGGIKNNRRSLVSVDNLVDLIVTCIEHPKAANQTFLISDNEDKSTTGLLENMASALNVPSRLLPVPAPWFNLISKLIRKPSISQRLCGSLQVDISKTMELLNWEPPYTSDESMKKTADAYLETLNKKK